MRATAAGSWVAAAVAIAAGTLSCDFDDAGPSAETLALGAETYASYCALCHGERGEGYAADGANALAHPLFLAAASDALIERGIARGRPATAMSAWGLARGGPLDERTVAALVAYIRRWQSLPPMDLGAVGTGEPKRGKPIYEISCQGCHGTEGRGGSFISVANPEMLATASDGFLGFAIRYGRPGTPMPGFGAQLTDQAIDDLVALIRSWQTPPDSGPTDLPSSDLGDPVLNRGGPDPDFGPDLYAPVVDVKAQLDAGAAMVLLDARPPLDYVAGHIAGAVSVPFYDVESYLAQLPTEYFTVSYCACPHAESTAAANTLLAHGYTKVKVIDEGYDAWVELGYPVSLGTEP